MPFTELINLSGYTENKITTISGSPILQGYISNMTGDNPYTNYAALTGVSARFYLDTYNDSNVFGSSYRGRRFRGTPILPSGILKDDVFLQLVGDGYDGSGVVTAKVSIFFAANENWVSGSGGGTYMAFRTTPSGTMAVAERMRIAHNGKVGVSNNNPEYTFDVSGSGNFTQGIYWNGNPVSTGNQGGGESNTASNQGNGFGLFSGKNGIDLQFYSLSGLTGSRINIDNNTNTLNISTYFNSGEKLNIGGVKLYDTGFANSSFPIFESIGGELFVPQQAWWHTANITAILPAATTSQTVIGDTATNGGTLSTIVTEDYGDMTNYVTAATNFVSDAGTSSTTPSYFRGSKVSPYNGFFFVSKFAFPNTTGLYIPSGCRFFCGLTDQTLATQVNSIEPAGNRVGLQFIRATGGDGRQDRFDTNFQITSKNNVIPFTGDTNMNFNTGLYAFYMFCPPYPNNSGIYWQLNHLSMGSGITGLITGNLPVGSTAMRMGCFIRNVSGIKNIRTQILYCKT